MTKGLRIACLKKNFIWNVEEVMIQILCYVTNDNVKY
jgi:hypothetical protein